MTCREAANYPQLVLALDAMVDQDLFICPRCASPVRPDGGLWHCTDMSCRYADQPFPVVAGIPALVDFEHSAVDLDRLRAPEGASEAPGSAWSRVRGRLLHPYNT